MINELFLYTFGQERRQLPAGLFSACLKRLQIIVAIHRSQLLNPPFDDSACVRLKLAKGHCERAQVTLGGEHVWNSAKGRTVRVMIVSYAAVPGPEAV